MDAVINVANQAQLRRIHSELFNIANSYSGNEYGDIAIQMHHITNTVGAMQQILEKLYDTPAEDRYSLECSPCMNQGTARCLGCKWHTEPDKVKPLAQYLSGYLNAEQLPIKRALDAYESTEQVKIRIERI